MVVATKLNEFSISDTHETSGALEEPRIAENTQRYSSMSQDRSPHLSTPIPPIILLWGPLNQTIAYQESITRSHHFKFPNERSGQLEQDIGG